MEGKNEIVVGKRIKNQILFTEVEKRLIIDDYLTGNLSKVAVYKRYTGRSSDHGTMIRWKSIRRTLKMFSTPTPASK